MDDTTKHNLQKVSDSMLGVARHLVAWSTAHLHLEVLLITSPWSDSDGSIRLKVDEMNDIAGNMGEVSKNLRPICDYFKIPFPHPEIGTADRLESVVKYAIKVHQKAEEMLLD